MMEVYRERPIRLLIVDDFEIMRRGLRDCLANCEDITVVGETERPDHILPLCTEALPDVILMDLTLPGVDSTAVAARIKQKYPHIQILTMICEYDDTQLNALLAVGVMGCLTPRCAADEIARAVRLAAKRQPVFSPEVSRLLMKNVIRPLQRDGLTQREQEILRFIASGMTNGEIAKRLDVSPFTIKNHVSRLLSKLGVNSRTEAAVLALREHIVQMD